MFPIPYWILPILAGLTWLGMLLGLLLGWLVAEHRPLYSSMEAGQTVAYISDIGASSRFKTVFIVLCCVTTALLDLTFAADRWLRHRRRLTPNDSTAQKVLGVLTLLFALAGTAGLVLLSVFDTAHHKRMHDGFLLLFIAGFLLSAICSCSQFQRLGIHHRQEPILRYSFWLKLAFILVELALAIAFAALSFTHHSNPAAVIEWAIAFIFTFYAWSFAVDLYPASRLGPRALTGRAGRDKGRFSDSTTMATDQHLCAAVDSDRDSSRIAAAPATLPPVDATANAEATFITPDNPTQTQHLRPQTQVFDAARASVEMQETGPGVYGESAARATRKPRSSRVIHTSGSDHVQSGSMSSANFQPGRSYDQ